MAKFRLYFTALLIAFVFAILPKYSLALSTDDLPFQPQDVIINGNPATDFLYFKANMFYDSCSYEFIIYTNAPMIGPNGPAFFVGTAQGGSYDRFIPYIDFVGFDKSNMKFYSRITSGSGCVSVYSSYNWQETFWL